MPGRRPRTPTRGAPRSIACLLLALAASGCATWQVFEEDPAQIMVGERPPKVRITQEGGEQTILTRPRVLGNVLAGFDDACIERFGQNTNECPETGVPLFEIQTLEVQKRGASYVYLPAIGGLLAAWLLANR